MSGALFDEDGHIFWWKVFFSIFKVGMILFVLVTASLIMAQSAVAPVSVRLLTTYGMEYAVERFKPIRPLFPEPYLHQINP